VRGTQEFVHDAEAAHVFLCAARGEHDQVSLVLVDADGPGITVTRQTGLLASVAQVQLDGVRVDGSCRLGQAGSGWTILERDLDEALLVLSAYQVGGCQRVFEFTVQYTRERVVFGQPIGRFQRVQDHVGGAGGPR
jgi:alkylation response protein AidB-like acyl-CoA dehydrogenase